MYIHYLYVCTFYECVYVCSIYVCVSEVYLCGYYLYVFSISMCESFVSVLYLCMQYVCVCSIFLCVFVYMCMKLVLNSGLDFYLLKLPLVMSRLSREPPSNLISREENWLFGARHIKAVGWPLLAFSVRLSSRVTKFA